MCGISWRKEDNLKSIGGVNEMCENPAAISLFAGIRGAGNAAGRFAKRLENSLTCMEARNF